MAGIEDIEHVLSKTVLKKSAYRLSVSAFFILLLVLVIVFRYRYISYAVGIDAKSSAEQIGVVYNLHPYFVNSIAAFLFIPILFIYIYLLSFNRERYLKGLVFSSIFTGVFFLILGIGSVKYSKIQDQCFVLALDGVDYYYLNGMTPSEIITNTGQSCEPIESKYLLSLAAYENGRIPIAKDMLSKFQFFAGNGMPLIWYSLSDDGTYAFYDMMGFDPITNQRLKPVEDEIFIKKILMLQEKLQKEKSDADAAIKKAESEAKEEEIFLELKAQAEKDAEQYKRDVENNIKIAAGDDCDILAGDPNDVNKNTRYSGVNINLIIENLSIAFEKCNIAAGHFPNNLRFKYQLARIYTADSSIHAKRLLEELVSRNYPAAYSLLGSLLYEEGQSGQLTAAKLFTEGERLGDAESAFRLGLMFYNGENFPRDVRKSLILLNKAAQKGHFEAFQLYSRVSKEADNSKLVSDLLGLGLVVGLSAIANN